jgi:hypothetical protein
MGLSPAIFLNHDWADYMGEGHARSITQMGKFLSPAKALDG